MSSLMFSFPTWAESDVSWDIARGVGDQVNSVSGESCTSIDERLEISNKVFQLVVDSLNVDVSN